MQASTFKNREGRNLYMKIADITFGLTSMNDELKLMLDGVASRFHTGIVEPDVKVNVSWADLTGESGGERLFDSGSLWQLYQANENYHFRFCNGRADNIPYKVAQFNADFTAGEVFLHKPFFDAGSALYPLEYPLDELVMMNLLARGRGVEVHSCGVVDRNGKGYLFVGQSGAGKTTSARLWEKEKGVSILSDDRIIVRKVEEKFWMYGTPWHGEAELAVASRAELTHIFFLRQGPRNSLEAQGVAESSARLLSCGFPTFHDACGLEFTLSFLEDLTSHVPAFELSFLPDASVVEFVREKTRVS
jgi:hypothetical protein